jgi:protein-S-isoprenylcysteine O-methyltransferase Ste14
MKHYAGHMHHSASVPLLSLHSTSPDANRVKPAGTIPSTPKGLLASIRIPATRGAVGLLIAGLLMTRSTWAEDAPVAAAALMAAGLLLTGVAAAGRLWCSIYIAGRKNRTLVMDGPYSMCRNPLYLFSLLGAAGVVMATGMISVTVAMVLLFLLYYRPVIRAEEIRLAGLFGEEFSSYRERVPRFIPRWSLFRHGESPEVNPRVFLDHALCVIWFPAAAGLLVLVHATELSLHLPVWFHLF